MTTTEGTMGRISAACVAAGYDEIEMHTPDARAWQLTTGPVDRMVVAYPDGAILCRTRGEGDIRCDDVVVAVAWVQATAWSREQVLAEAGARILSALED